MLRAHTQRKTIMPVTKKPVSESELHAWSECLMDANASLTDRSRALWGLRHADEPLALELIARFACDLVPPAPAASELLQHEAAYCLGQRGDPRAVPHLIRVVRDSRHTPIVRHEAAEALAALYAHRQDMEGGHEDIYAVLKEYADCNVVEVSFPANVCCTMWSLPNTETFRYG